MSLTTAARRIALMLESDGPGGAETMLLQLATELRRRGHQVLAVGPANGCGWLGERFRHHGFDTDVFHLRRTVDPACASGLAQTLSRHRIDLVHSHEFTMAVYGAVAAGTVRVPHVFTLHGGLSVFRKWRRRAALRWALARSRAGVAVSSAAQATMARALGVPSHRIQAIPNGIAFTPGDREAARRALGVQPGELLVLAVGNLGVVKGHIVLLRALAGLDAGLPWRVAIAGRGTEEGNLRAWAQSAGIAGRLQLLGHRDDVPDLLAAADVYAMPSLSEGLPMALLEAMFARAPIVASRTGGIPEVLRDGIDGLLAEPGDETSLRSALARLLGRPELRAALGQAAHARAAAGYSAEVMTDAYERAYGFRPVDASRLARGERPGGGR
jgi:glycosyltransferase involved in cell wall biosynthesis